MATIRSAGIGSGLDVNQIVTDLVAADREPFDKKYESNQVQITEKISAFATIKSAVSELDDALFDIKLSTSFNLRKVDYSSENFTATAGSLAQPGSYSIEVQSVAKAEKISSNTAFSSGESLGAGTLSIALGADAFEMTVDADDTLTDIKNRINADGSNPGVTASLVTGDDGQHLVLTSSKLGLTNTISVNVTDDDGSLIDGIGLSRLAQDGTNTNFTVNQSASDASILIDGSVIVTNDSNYFENAVEGVALTVTQVHAPGESDDITISLDKESSKEKITKFVESFNKMVDEIETYTKVDIEARQLGLLSSDSTLRTMMTQLRRTISQPVMSESGNPFSLSAIGIQTDRQGRLEIDEKQLDSMFDSNFDEMATLFTGDEGIAKHLANIVTDYDKHQGILDSKVDSLRREGDRWDQEKMSNDLKLKNYEELLFKQFLAMDKTVAILKATGDYLTTQLQNLPGMVKKDN